MYYFWSLVLYNMRIDMPIKAAIEDFSFTVQLLESMVNWRTCIGSKSGSFKLPLLYFEYFIFVDNDCKQSFLCFIKQGKAIF